MPVSDFCPSKQVTLQSNGIVRDESNEIIGRLITTEELDRFREFERIQKTKENQNLNFIENKFIVGKWHKSWETTPSGYTLFMPNFSCYVAYTMDGQNVLAKYYDPMKQLNFNFSNVIILGYIQVPEVTDVEAMAILQSCPFIR